MSVASKLGLRLRLTSTFAFVAIAVAVGGVGAWRAATTLQNQKSQKPATCSSWKVVRSPAVSDGILHSVSGTSSTDVWAVGDTSGQPPIIEHWNGYQWKEYAQTAINGTLASVSAITPTDAWAIGYKFQGSDPTLTEHWDGTAWRRVTSPNPGSEDVLNASVAIATNDVWAAGDYLVPNGSTIQPLYLHWDGVSWTHIPEAPGLSSGGIVVSIAASSSSDVWAVGYVGHPTSSDALIEHWDGTAWSVVPAAPPPISESSHANDIAAIASDDAWSVFWGSGSPYPYAEHWDGNVWTIVPTPVVSSSLSSVAAVSSSDVWAVGSMAVGSFTHAFSEHWDGSSWTQIATPAPAQQSILTSVTALSATDIWAVGFYDGSGGTSGPLIMHSRGVC